jgi:diguanylate cyclase (GGDEF)-like protein/putative nucleotidyltransferase with HDIG domain
MKALVRRVASFSGTLGNEGSRVDMPAGPARELREEGGVAHPTALSVYVTVVIAAGTTLLVARLPFIDFDHGMLFLALLLASVMISASKVHLPLASGSATLSMSYFTDFMSLVFLGADAAMIVAGAGGVIQCLVSRRGRASLRQTLFSVAALVITAQAAGLAATLLGGFPPGADLAVLAKPAVVASVTFFLCNSWLVAVAVGLSRGESLLRSWHENFLWTAPACFIGAGVAVLAVRVIMSTHLWVALLVAAPLYLTYRSYQIYLGRLEDHQQHLKEVSELHLATVEALARAIDARDQTIERSSSSSDNHIRRVQAMAAELGRSAGMPASDVEGLKVAALLHDIGKLAVPEHILTKPGRLTPDEFERVQVHPAIGAEIIRAVPFPYPVAPFIHSHHERWDGSGYPDGLKGEQIPLGARVLAIVDYFDALTTDRPYHRAMDPADAREVVRSEAGKALDPVLVARFIELLPRFDFDESEGRHEQSSRPVTRISAPITGFSSETESSAPLANVFHNISRVTQEMNALYDLAQTLGTRLSVNDTMALLTSKLNRLVPASCWALYLYDEGSKSLECRFATGIDANVVERLRIRAGEGPSGWAARHRTAAMNARAAADFEAAGMPDACRVFTSALALPLVDEDVLVGTLTIYHTDANPYSDEHRRLLDRVCNQVASVIRNSVLFEQMHQVSFTDSLTELPNSRALFAHLHDQFTGQALRPGVGALLMIDLDEFKTINDEHGHQTGDLTLKQVATAIRQNVRHSDFCARYAGDEFVVVLSQCNRKEAEERARHLQRAIDATAIEVRPGVVLTPGISIGVAVSPEDGETYDELLAAADRRMYENKQQRRRDRDGAGESGRAVRFAQTA